MADNIQTPTGSGSDPAVATDQIGGAHYQKVKLALGAENELDGLVDAGQQIMANSLPVVIASNQSPVPVDATPAAPAANDYLPVRLTDGAAFYAAGGGSGGGAAAQTDKSAFTEGTSSFAPIGGTFNESSAGDPAEDQAAAVRITAKRALHVNLRNAAGAELGGAATPVRTDPTGATTQPVSGTVTANAGAGPWPVTDNGGALTVDNAGAFAVQDSEKIADNAAFTDGASKVMPAGFVLDETAGPALAENDAAAARIDAKRAQVAVIEDGVARGTRLAVKGAGSAPLVSDPAAVVALSPNGYHRLATYAAVYRLAARPYALSHAFAANSRKQFATLHHAASATKTVRIRRVQVALKSNSVAAVIDADLVFITTAPATGNPAVTPASLNRGDAAAEAVALALPTTAATEAALIATVEYNLGITGAASTVNPPPAVDWRDLYNSDGIDGDDAAKALALRAGQLEGIAVVLDASAAATVTAYVRIVFTEE